MSAAVLREVRLYGALGRQFGRVFRLAVATPAEAVHALCCVLPGFEKAFLGRDGRAAYHVFVGRGEQRRDIPEAEAGAPLGATDPIRLVPVVAGAKRGGALQTITGYVLTWVGYALFVNGFPALGQFVNQLGYSMMLSGVVQMLSPQRPKEQRVENQPSYAFDGPLNNVEQGGPVPLLFGRVICGSVVVSQGLSTEELVLQTAPPALDPVPLPPWEEPAPDGGGT